MGIADGDVTAASGDVSNYLTGTVIPAEQQEKAVYESEADQARKQQELIRQQQQAQIAPLEEQLSKGFMSSGYAAAPPKYNIGTLMQSAPLFMTMAAMLGSKGRLVGTAGISAINGMVNGLVKGDVMQYEAHRQEYEQHVRDWHEYAAHTQAMVAELRKTYGDRAQDYGKAEMAAMRMAGQAGVSISKAMSQVALLAKSSDALKAHDAEADARLQETIRRDDMTAASRAASLSEKTVEFTQRVAKEKSDELNKTYKEIDSSIKGIRAQYAGKKMPEEVLQEIGRLKQLQGAILDKQLRAGDQPQPGADGSLGKGPATPMTDEQKKKALADADSVYRSSMGPDGRVPPEKVAQIKAAVKQRLGVDWNPPAPTAPPPPLGPRSGDRAPAIHG